MPVTTYAQSPDQSIESLLEKGSYDQAVKSSEGSSHYLASLISRARDKKLSDMAVWRALIHYKTSWLTGIDSQVDSADFFLSEAGKYDPQAELEATLASFFSEKMVAPSKYAPQCRFPARFLWLNQQLQFDPTKITIQECADLKKYKEVLDPESLTVVFPSTHPNSPSSMFGHTLLRINKKNQTDQTRMLAFSINYAAQVDRDAGIIAYTMLGLTGGYFGKFSVLPYYVKLREYAQMENRDLWEYDLDIPKQQLDFLLLHTFEMSYSFLDYYFFTENCSYHLLTLLDVLNADNPMADEFTGWTIPIDTVKLMGRRNMLSNARFYPSLARKINTRRNELSDIEQSLVLAAQQNGIKSNIDDIQKLDQARQIKILDLLTDYLRYRKIEDSLETVSSKLNKAEREVLLYRSKLRGSDVSLSVKQPGISPDQGHDTARTGIAYGSIYNLHYTDIEWRPAYHDILDNSQGFISNSGLEFMKIKVRHLSDSGETQLQQVDILNIQSLEPRDTFFHGLSWHGEIGWKKAILDDTGQWRNVIHATGGKGVTYELSNNNNAYLFGFADASLIINEQIESDYSVMPGLNVGLIIEPMPGWRISSSAKYYQGILGDDIASYKFKLRQSFALARNVSLRIIAEREKFDNVRFNNVSAQLYLYF